MRESVKERVKEILTHYLEQNNYRKTPERYTILDAVYSTTDHFTLEELGDKLVSEYNFLVSRATLYNTLKLFMELRLVIRHRVQSTTRYEACYDNNGHCHQVCTMCGRVTEIQSQPVADAIKSLRTKRFHKDGFTLYIYGICSSCQAVATRRARLEEKRKNQKK
jgi:Fur family ferric uptake transcriptional regulator